MRRPSRLTTVALLALAGWLLLPAAAALADQSPTVTECAAKPAGDPCIVVAGSADHPTATVGATTTFTFTLRNVGGAGDPVRVSIDTDLTLDRSSVELDGHAATLSGDSLASEIGVASAQTRTLTFRADRSGDATHGPATTTVSTSGGSRSNDVVTRLPDHDIAVSTDDPHAVAAGNPRTGVPFEVIVSNVGADAADVQLHFTLPAGWAARPAAGYEQNVSCRAGGSAGRDVTCTLTRPIGDDGNSHYVGLDALPPTSAPGGTRLDLTVTATIDSATDADSTNNATTVHLLDAGTADVRTTVSQDASQVVTGKRMTFTVTVRNAGPDPTHGLSLYVSVDSTTHHGVTQLNAHGPGSIEYGSADEPIALSPFVWEPGAIAPGRSVQLTVQWRGEKIASTQRLLVTFSEDAADPGATVRSGQYQFDAVRSSPVSVVSHLATGGSGASGGTQDPQLAATGSDVGGQLGLAGALVLLGLVALLAARRPGRHRA